MYVFLAFWYFIGMVLALRIMRSPVGHILRAIRENPLRAQAVGHNIQAYKHIAFVVAAAYAGFAGGLLGVMQGFMPPDAFMFDTSGQLVMQTAIGGAGTLFGPLVGAAVWLYLSDFFQTTLHLGRHVEAGAGHRLRAAGRVPAPRHRRRRSSICMAGLPAAAGGRTKPPNPIRTRSQAAADPSPPRSPGMSRPTPAPVELGEPILQAEQLSKRYGGLIANSNIDFTVRRGELRGIIGPNGAGKSTFFKMLTCEIAPTTRPHHLRGQGHHRARRHRGVPARPDQELPGQPALHPAVGARERHHCRPVEARAVQARPAAQHGKRGGARRSRSKRRWRWCV